MQSVQQQSSAEIELLNQLVATLEREIHSKNMEHQTIMKELHNLENQNREMSSRYHHLQNYIAQKDLQAKQTISILQSCLRSAEDQINKKDQEIKTIKEDFEALALKTSQLQSSAKQGAQENSLLSSSNKPFRKQHQSKKALSSSCHQSQPFNRASNLQFEIFSKHSQSEGQQSRQDCSKPKKGSHHSLKYPKEDQNDAKDSESFRTCEVYTVKMGDFAENKESISKELEQKDQLVRQIRDENVKIRQEGEDLKKKIEQLLCANELKQQKIMVLHEQKEVLRLNFEALRQQNEQLKGEVSKVKQDVVQLQSAAQKQTTFNQELQTLQKQWGQESAQKAKKLETAQESLRQKVFEVDSKERAVQELKLKIEAFEAATTAIQKHNAELMEEISLKDVSIETLQQKISSLESKIASPRGYQQKYSAGEANSDTGIQRGNNEGGSANSELRQKGVSKFHQNSGTNERDSLIGMQQVDQQRSSCRMRQYYEITDEKQSKYNKSNAHSLDLPRFDQTPKNRATDDQEINNSSGVRKPGCLSAQKGSSPLGKSDNEIIGKERKDSLVDLSQYLKLESDFEEFKRVSREEKDQLEGKIEDLVEALMQRNRGSGVEDVASSLQLLAEPQEKLHVDQSFKRDALLEPTQRIAKQSVKCEMTDVREPQQRGKNQLNQNQEDSQPQVQEHHQEPKPESECPSSAIQLTNCSGESKGGHEKLGQYGFQNQSHVQSPGEGQSKSKEEMDINYFRNSIAQFGSDIDFSSIAKHIGIEVEAGSVRKSCEGTREQYQAKHGNGHPQVSSHPQDSSEDINNSESKKNGAQGVDCPQKQNQEAKLPDQYLDKNQLHSGGKFQSMRPSHDNSYQCTQIWLRYEKHLQQLNTKAKSITQMLSEIGVQPTQSVQEEQPKFQESKEFNEQVWGSSTLKTKADLSKEGLKISENSELENCLDSLPNWISSCSSRLNKLKEENEGLEGKVQLLLGNLSQMSKTSTERIAKEKKARKEAEEKIRAELQEKITVKFAEQNSRNLEQISSLTDSNNQHLSKINELTEEIQKLSEAFLILENKQSQKQAPFDQDLSQDGQKLFNRTPEEPTNRTQILRNEENIVEDSRNSELKRKIEGLQRDMTKLKQEKQLSFTNYKLKIQEYEDFIEQQELMFEKAQNESKQMIQERSLKTPLNNEQELSALQTQILSLKEKCENQTNEKQKVENELKVFKSESQSTLSVKLKEIKSMEEKLKQIDILNQQCCLLAEELSLAQKKLQLQEQSHQAITKDHVLSLESLQKQRIKLIEDLQSARILNSRSTDLQNEQQTPKASESGFSNQLTLELERQILVLNQTIASLRQELKQKTDLLLNRDELIFELNSKIEALENSLNSEIMLLNGRNASLTSELLSIKKEMFKSQELHVRGQLSSEGVSKEKDISKLMGDSAPPPASSADIKQFIDANFMSDLQKHPHSTSKQRHSVGKDRSVTDSELYNKALHRSGVPEDISNILSYNTYSNQRVNASGSSYDSAKHNLGPLNMGEMFIGRKVKLRADTYNRTFDEMGQKDSWSNGSRSNHQSKSQSPLAAMFRNQRSQQDWNFNPAGKAGRNSEVYREQFLEHYHNTKAEYCYQMEGTDSRINSRRSDLGGEPMEPSYGSRKR